MTTLTGDPPRTRESGTRWGPPAPVGVVDAHGVLYRSGAVTRRLRYVPASAGGALDLAESLGLGQMWFHRDALDAAGLPFELPPEATKPPDFPGLAHPFHDAPGVWQTSARGLLPWMPAWRPGLPVRVQIAVPAWDTQDAPWAHAETPTELLDALELYQRATAFPWVRNGGLTSDAWLRRQHPRLRAAELPELVREVNELPLAWHRAPDLTEHKRARWCHAFDLNGQYLAAPSSLSLPAGSLQPSPGWEHGGQRPGLWLMELPPWTHPRLPAPWHGEAGERVWVTTPTVELALELGAAPPERGWTWAEHHRFLEPWYRWLRDARAGLRGDVRQSAELALAAVKQVYARGVGRLGNLERARGSSDPLYQPVWRQSVVAMARANWWRRLHKIGEQPVAVDADCAYFLTNSAKPELFALRAQIPLGTELGKMKPAGSSPADPVRDALAGDHTPTVLRTLRELVA